MVLDPSWSQEEIDDLLAGRPVSTRTASACKTKRFRLVGKQGRNKRRVEQVPREGWVEGEALIEPDWWGTARRLEASGLGPVAIAATLKKSRHAVRYALDPDFRRQQKIRNNHRCHNPEYKKRRSSTRVKGIVDSKRAEARAEARERWRSRGGKLINFYRELDCL